MNDLLEALRAGKQAAKISAPPSRDVRPLLPSDCLILPRDRIRQSNDSIRLAPDIAHTYAGPVSRGTTS
ncbi:hypothetical protein EMIT047CA2_20415 [Pseudomonas soli]